ncbi:hypothetical protein [Flaviaesturariibacter amylovorans]|uniref:hypothetical protein n=1 Tax=Flaviaesturariibacter amylovorans TaxID=1084520 RepID=UPI0031F10379
MKRPLTLILLVVLLFSVSSEQRFESRFTWATLISVYAFLLILISGEDFGGPYILYLLLGAPHGATYAMSGIVGLLLATYSVVPKRIGLMPLAGSITGHSLMIWSLFLFFSGERLAYNMPTFSQVLPLISFIAFALCAVGVLTLFFVRLYGLYSRFRRRYPSLNSCAKGAPAS